MKSDNNYLFYLLAASVIYFGLSNSSDAATPDGISIDPGYIPNVDNTNNLDAFLAVIRQSEVGDAGPNGYHIFYGGSTFDDFSDHPVLTGEKQGIRLSDTTCRNAGFGPGCVSTAAGAYQINKPTWQTFRVDMGDGYGYLPNFSPESQDIAAKRILTSTGAIPYINAGDIDQAARLASGRWASLPGSTSKQSQHPLTTIVGWFASFGGLLA